MALYSVSYNGGGGLLFPSYSAIYPTTNEISDSETGMITQGLIEDTNIYTSDVFTVSIDREVFNAKCHLYIPDAGTIDFRIRDLVDGTLNLVSVTIGYRAYYDFSGGNILYKLVVNGSPNDAYTLTASVCEFFPIATNQNFQAFGELVQNVGSFSCGLIGGVVGMAIGDKDAITQGSQKTIGSVVNQYTALHDLYKSPATYRGNLGGSYDHAASERSMFLWIEKNEEISGSTFSSQFGYPDGQTKKISSSISAAGYYQTGANTHVRAAGYNETIVEGAREALQSGFKIV